MPTPKNTTPEFLGRLVICQISSGKLSLSICFCSAALCHSYAFSWAQTRKVTSIRIYQNIICYGLLRYATITYYAKKRGWQNGAAWTQELICCVEIPLDISRLLVSMMDRDGTCRDPFNASRSILCTYCAAKSADFHTAALKVSSMSSVICHMSCWGEVSMPTSPVTLQLQWLYNMTHKLTITHLRVRSLCICAKMHRLARWGYNSSRPV